ncbi:hypothetical protein G9A89_015445 [Geosiphon pyriformis]|nr:hypothetical protein G9A89_015445 [Geosiphon pyriformis]
MTTTRAKSKKTTPDICSKISNKISTRGALSVVEATRQNVLEAFPLPSNREKLPLVATESTSPSLAGFLPVKVPSKRHTWVSPRALSVVEATRQNVLEAFPLPSNREKLPLVATESTSPSLAGFLPVKVPSKRHTWVSPSVASIPTKSPKVFNNRPVNKLVFPSIDSTPGASGTTFSKKMIKKTKSSEKWRQSLAFAIVTPNPFVVPNEILDEISVASSGTSSKMGQDQPLAVLPNVVFSGRSSPVLEAKQSPPVGSSVLGNWADQMETDLSPSLTVFQSVHSFLGAKSVSKDNVKLFYVEFASQQSLEAAFLVELTSSVCLATLKIAKSLVVSKFGSSSAAVVLCDVSLGVSAADIKLALGVFGSVARVVLKPASIWQYVVVYFEKLDSAVSALKHWSVLVGKDSVRILPPIGGCTCFIFHSPDSGRHSRFTLVTFGSQDDLNSAVVKTGTLRKCCIWWKTPGCWRCFKCQEMGHLAIDCKIFPPFTPKIPKVFKSRFVGFASYAKTAAPSGLSEFPLLVASLAASVVDPAVGSRLDSLEKQISNLAALVKSIVKLVSSLVALVSRLLDDNAAKAVQVEKNLISMKSAANNFSNLLVEVSKDIACLRSEVDFSDMDYDGMLATKPSFLSKDTIEHVIALWRMSGAETKGNIESTRLFLSEFIFDSRNLNGIIERIRGLGLFPPTFDSV